MSDDERDIDFSDNDSGDEEIYKSNLKKNKKIIAEINDEDEYDTADEEDDKKEEEEEEEDDNIEEEEEDEEYDSMEDEDMEPSNLKTKYDEKNRKNGELVSGDEDEEEEDEDEDEDEETENYLKKFDEDIKKNIITDYYPELVQHNSEEVEAMSVVTRNQLGIIIDPLHQTLPFLTKYEKARILGERAKQLDAGALPFVSIDETVISGYLIALKELEEKKIPFIVKRPLPNGGCEYWRLKDLEIL
jgi:DNA-directed RNA polymerase subunit K/omega